MKYLTRASRSNTGTSVKSLWICGGESVSLPPKSLIPSQWTRVPNDLTTLYEFGIMGMPIPLHVFVGEFPSDSSSSWRSNLQIGSSIDFKSEDNTWREARVVETIGTSSLVIHCLGWVDRSSELYRISDVSRDSPRVSRSHSHVRDWREQLRVNTPVEIHKSLMSDISSDPEIVASKRPIYRCTTAIDPKGST